MTYLLDTHTLIWAIVEPQKLPQPVIRILENTDNEIMVSAISFWEIALKHSIQKLMLEGLTPDDFPEAAEQTGFTLLPLNCTTAASYHKLLSTYHRDPFDRMLIWHAMQNNFTLISKDLNVAHYVSEGLKIMW